MNVKAKIEAKRAQLEVEIDAYKHVQRAADRQRGRFGGQGRASKGEVMCDLLTENQILVEMHLVMC